ncbi:MFS transporter [Rhodococcus jostii]|uniref:MFS transporter n=1 Tax=Rhodococcus jostii TaxID=132919 RepID=A0ABU4CSN0_RHOJO|nr:MFS transporter [Rhodococcus jostii]MDV6286576.1 MFS transporter [Rhodococcus jostii]
MSADALVSPQERAALLAKVTRRLMPLLVGMYILSFLNRSNIGIAKPDLEADLGIGAAAYGLGAGLFFLAYALCEVPSNLIMHRVGARRWMARIMVSWGAISTATFWVQGEWSFYALRFLLGIAEAGLFPGVMLYLTYWFPKAERARAMGIFLLGAAAALIFGPIFGGFVLNLEGVLGLHGWQWLFLSEGIPTILVGIYVFFVLPDKPGDATWLTDNERRQIEGLIEFDNEGGEHRHVFSLRAMIKNRLVVLVALTYFTHQLCIYAVTFFFPGIIAQTFPGISNVSLGLLAGIPWVAAAIGALTIPRLANRFGSWTKVMLPAFFAIPLGLVVAAATGPIGGILGMTLAASVFFGVQPLLFSLPSLRLAGTALAGGIALINSIGLTGGFIGPYAMGLIEETTGSSDPGLYLLAGFGALGCIGSSLLHRMLTRTGEQAAVLRAAQPAGGVVHGGTRASVSESAERVGNSDVVG